MQVRGAVGGGWCITVGMKRGEKAGIQLCMSEFGGGWGVGEDGGDEERAADGAHKRQLLGPVFTPTQLRLLPRYDGARNRGGGMANREVRRPLFHLMGRVGVRDAVNPREEKGAEHQHAHNVEMGRGMVCSRFVPWNRALRSEMVTVAEMRWLGWGEPRRAVCGEVNQRQQSVILTTASVVYCSEIIILINKIKTTLLTFDAWLLCCFGETWSGDVGRKRAGDETSIHVIQ